ncbi:MAG: MltA domain-containing protein [Xanthobacteraceae bacterium]|nr:MltA domain-containing protein [Xanthobacteraceae bacterium]
MSGPSRATFRRAIRTGSWLAPRAHTEVNRISRARLCVVALCCVATTISLGVATAMARVRHVGHRAASKEIIKVRPRPESILWPIEIPGSQYTPLLWSDVVGWSDDDQLAAFKAFRVSCAPIAAQTGAPPDDKFLGASLRPPCKAARGAQITDSAAARSFFERYFVPLQISRLGEDAGFVTGYYEPVVEGSRTKSDIYNVPVYRRPSNLFVRGYNQASPNLPNKGQVFRKIGRRKLVPYYDRSEIEDGAIAGRGLEVVWLKNQTDLLFIQIQGSARIKLEDGSMVRINYDAHNGFPYTPVGRVLIERNIIPKDQMSMQRIREYMEQNPGAADELRRQNKSYVFFREVSLSDKDEAVGAQGVPLTPGRSIAVDKSLHLYGTPFYIDAMLPIDSDTSNTPFRRLMVAQDTGSAIVGPARADLYFGAGVDAGRVAGRIKNAARFALLLPKELDPAVRAKTIPLPDERPSAEIAKEFPQKPMPKSPADDSAKGPVAPAKNSDAKDSTAKPAVPLPEARPMDAPQNTSSIKEEHESRRRERHRYRSRHRQ